MPVEAAPCPRGEVRLHRVAGRPVCVWHQEDDGRTIQRPTSLVLPGWLPVTDWTHNDVLYEWGAIVGNLLLRRGNQYGIGGMYIEFENVADPDDPVTPPVVTRGPGEGIDYYNDLGTSPNRDYLRVPLIAGTLEVSDADKFPKGNMPVFFAQTSGLVGTHGKPFSDVNNSKVFGAALVAFVDKDDATRDLVLSRWYAGAGDQQAKLPTSQVGVEWRLKLT